MFGARPAHFRLRLWNRATRDVVRGAGGQAITPFAALAGSARCRTGFGHNELRRRQAPPGEKGPAAFVRFSGAAGPFSPGYAKPLPCLL
jgi:hypothetical protein